MSTYTQIVHKVSRYTLQHELIIPKDTNIKIHQTQDLVDDAHIITLSKRQKEKNADLAFRIGDMMFQNYPWGTYTLPF